jgi:hypothetical protein
MSDLSSRHEGDLDGQLKPFAGSRTTPVTLILESSAKHAAVQHCAWMLANMLVRFEGFVERVSICCPDGIPTKPEVYPLQGADFKEALIGATRRLNLISVTTDEVVGLVFRVGPGTAPDSGWRVYGDGWTGGITRSEMIPPPQSALPFGPYAAACLAASEVFKQARMKPEHYVQSEGFFDLWRFRVTKEFENAGPESLPVSELACILAGVGAVGCSFLHTMASCPTLRLTATLADNDKKGIDLSNLNRYVLFGKDSIGRLKPDRACELLQSTHLKLESWNESIGMLPRVEGRVLSAVDTNRAREIIQNKFPARILSASTSQLRAEVLRCGPPGKGACLRCHNPPEVLPSDSELITRLKNAEVSDFEKICAATNVAVADARMWISTEKCGQEGSALLQYLRTTDSDQSVGSFSVGFTSVLAGVLLAAEFVKDSLGAEVPLDGSKNRGNFQFWDLLSEVNSASFIARDTECPCCAPDRPGLRIWSERFERLSSLRA